MDSPWVRRVLQQVNVVLAWEQAGGFNLPAQQRIARERLTARRKLRTLLREKEAEAGGAR